MILLVLVPFPRLLYDCSLSFFRSILPALARHHSLLYFPISFGLQLFLALLIDVEEGERISDQILFDVLIERSIRGEAGSIVDLQEVGVELMVKHDIEPQYFKAHVIGEIVRVD